MILQHEKSVNEHSNYIIQDRVRIFTNEIKHASIIDSINLYGIIFPILTHFE